MSEEQAFVPPPHRYEFDHVVVIREGSTLLFGTVCTITWDLRKTCWEYGVSFSPAYFKCVWEDMIIGQALLMMEKQDV